MKKLLLSIFLLISLLSSSRGQDVTVTSAFDTSRIYIGDQIFYTVTVKQPPDLKLDIQTFKDSLYKNIEILSGPIQDSIVSKDNILRIVNKYLVTSFDSGIYQVPPVYAEIKDKNGIKRFYSEYTPLEVMRVKMTPPDTTAKIFDIVGPYRAPLTLQEIIPWVFLAIVAAAVVWVILRFSKRLRKSGKEDIPVMNPDPAHVIAFRELDKLKNEELWQKGEIKLYYSRLTEILRQYLENRYAVYSLEMTTSETLEALIKTGFKKDENYTDLKNILNGSDLVKFAKYKPEPSENVLHFEKSWKFIEATKVVVEISEPADKKEDKEVTK
jgi:hypothetical protein